MNRYCEHNRENNRQTGEECPYCKIEALETMNQEKEPKSKWWPVSKQDTGRELGNPNWTEWATKYIKDLEDRLKAAEADLIKIKALVNEQAEDEGLWFRAETAPEAYLQNHLRVLHGVIEGKSPFNCACEAITKAVRGEGHPMNDELKACPFCGGKALAFIPGDAPADEPPHWITCSDCQADGPHKDAVKDVVAGWNTRHPTPEAPADYRIFKKEKCPDKYNEKCEYIECSEYEKCEYIECSECSEAPAAEKCEDIPFKGTCDHGKAPGLCMICHPRKDPLKRKP